MLDCDWSSDVCSSDLICTGCAVGCNISPGERYGEIRRIENRYHGEINGYFLCDRGRFGYAHNNSKDRPRQPLVRQNDSFVAKPKADAITLAVQLLKSGKTVIGIGSPRATLEANHALRSLVGAGNFYAGVSAQDSALTALTLKVLR
jgi:NADH-quinone oxidoreductase subunit G